MRLEVDSSHFIDFNYKLKEDYLVDFDINLIGMNEVIPNELNFMNLQWQMKTPQTEKSRENPLEEMMKKFTEKNSGENSSEKVEMDDDLYVDFEEMEDNEN